MTPLLDPLICDMVVPLAPIVGNDLDLLLRYRAAGHAYVSITIAGDDCDLGTAIHRLSQARCALRARESEFVVCTTVDQIAAARAAGKLAVGLHLEGTECLERDPDVLDLMYDVGIRYCILAFNRNNSAAGGCADLGNVGLSRLGRRYVERMRTLGMLLDLSHTSERSTFDAMEHIGGPVLFTHSNVAGLHPHYRNLTDAQIKACAASGGLIGVSGSSAYLGEDGSLDATMFRHIDRLVELAGPEHVGIGTDYVVDDEAITAIFAERPDEWPVDATVRYDALSYMPPEDLAKVIERMRGAGYDEATITGILGGNFIQVARSVWK